MRSPLKFKFPVLFASFLMSSFLWAGGTQAPLTVSSGTFLSIDLYANNDGANRQAIVLGDKTSSDTLKVDGVVGIPVYLSTQTTAVAQPIISTNTLPVSGTFWQTTQPISGAVSIANPSVGVYTVTNSTNPLIIQSTSTIPVSISGNQAVNAAQFGGQNTLMSGNSGEPRISCDISGSSNTVIASVTSGPTNIVSIATQAVSMSGNAGEMRVSCDISGSSNTVNATVTSGPTNVVSIATQSVLMSGNAGEMRVACDINGSSNTVAGTVTANQGGTWGVNINNPSLGVYTVTNSTNPLLIQSTNTINVSQQGNITINSPAVTQSGTWGVNINNPSLGVYTVTNSTNPLLVQSTSTLPIGGIAKTSLPTAASDGAFVAGLRDKFGRNVTIGDCPRDLILSTGAVLTTTIAEYVLLSSGAASVFNDPIALVLTNSSATGTLLTFRSNGNGTTSTLHFYVPPTDTRGFTLPHIWPQGTSAANWTVQSSASVTSIYVDMTYCQNK